MNSTPNTPAPMPSGFFQNMSNFFFGKNEITNGITGFKSVKFYLVLALYLASTVILAHDAFFFSYGSFQWNQPILVVLTAFLVISTINWELLLTGKPEGANLLLQCVLVIPFAIFIARILGKPAAPQDANLTSWVAHYADEAGKLILPDFLIKPLEWAAAFFQNIWLLVLIVILEIALCFKGQKLKAGILCTFIAVIFIKSLSEIRHPGMFLLGTAFLFVGFALQACNYARLAYFEQVVDSMPMASDSRLLGTILRCMSIMYESEKMEERQFLQIVRSSYSPHGEYPEGDVKAIAGEISRKMIFEYSLVSLNGSKDGYFAYPKSSLFHANNLLYYISIIPRIAIISVIALLWLASPVDLIPDFLPFGGLDDAIIAILSTVVAKRSLVDIHAQGPKE